MVRSRILMVIGLFFALPVMAAEPAPQATQSPRIHYTACSLAESMISKLGVTKMSAADAQRTCQQLAPNMNDTDRAEFMRCCTARFK